MIYLFGDTSKKKLEGYHVKNIICKMLEPISAHCAGADSAKMPTNQGHRVGKSQLIRAQSWKKPTNQGTELEKDNESGQRMGKRPTNQGGEWENGQPIRAQNGTMANQSGQRMGGRLFSTPKHLFTLYCWPFSFKSVCFLFLQARLKIHPAEYIQ